MNLVEQLTEIYLTQENWHEHKLSESDSNEYHKLLLDNGNIVTVSDGDILIGYCEFWRVSFEQFGRIICGEPFSAVHENVINGQIAYVANVFIQPEFRKTGVIRMLRNRFYEFNKECTHFCGNARRKKSEPVKVFKRDKIFINKGVILNGC